MDLSHNMEVTLVNEVLTHMHQSDLVSASLSVLGKRAGGMTCRYMSAWIQCGWLARAHHFQSLLLKAMLNTSP